jgi:hypothetical protein
MDLNSRMIKASQKLNSEKGSPFCLHLLVFSIFSVVITVITVLMRSKCSDILPY